MTDLLKKRIKEYNIPALTGQPIFDNVEVWRLPIEEKTAGGIILPDVAQDVDNRGVLLACGLKALDQLYAEGVEPGHIIRFGRYAGDEREVSQRKAGTVGAKMLSLHARDVAYSEDLLASLKSGALRVVRDDEGEHAIEDVETNKIRHIVKESK